MACNDPTIFFFEDLPAGAEYKLTITGPAGEFSASPDFTEGNTRVVVPLPTPPGTVTLPAAPGRTHGVSIALLFVTACTVKVEASCSGQSFCRDVNGSAGEGVSLIHGLRMNAEGAGTLAIQGVGVTLKPKPKPKPKPKRKPRRKRKGPRR